MKKIIVLILVSIVLVNCKSKEKKQDFTALTKSYFDDKNALSPLDATINGQNQYNDQLQLDMTDSYRKAQGAFFDKYETALANIEESQLNEEEQNSYEIIKWEINIGKDLLKLPTNLMPINQFWGTHLTMGQFAGATGAQPFKTKEDYSNFLKRMDTYSVWIDSAIGERRCASKNVNSKNNSRISGYDNSKSRRQPFLCFY
jgi:uncharacterized protein (DUF885 family)